MADTDTPFVWGAGGEQLTPGVLAGRRKIAEAMAAQGMDASPIRSAWQGLDRVAKAALGAYETKQLDQQESAARQGAIADIVSSIQGGLPGGASTASASPPGAVPAAAPAAAPGTAPVAAASGDPAAAIASIESGGRYDLLGPVTKSGDRAYGKYQVMGANIPEWTKAHLGQAMTPDQFLASPEAQDAVFKGQFGQYTQKYGPEGAAKAWFAGERGMTNPNARDQLGTTVQAYADRFNKAYGAPPAAAAVDPTALPANAQSTEGYVIPGQPSPAVRTVMGAMPAGGAGAAPSSAPQPGVATLLRALSNPFLPPQMASVGAAILQHQLQGDAVTTVDLGNKIGIMDKRGNMIRSIDKGEPNKGPEYGVIGKDEFGNEQYGWRDPRTQTVTPFKPQAPAAAQPSAIPAPPAGVDPKVWRETFSKNAAAGAVPGSFDDTAKLRGEFTGLPSYKNMAQAAPIYQAMHEAAGRNTKAADLNMVYGLGKIMDPGSVVREGEIQMANNAQGWQEKLNGIIGQINNQGGLTPEGRRALMQEAYGRLQAYKQQFDQDATRYRGISERNRINADDVVPDFGEFKPWEPTPAAAAAPASAPAAAPAAGGWTDLGGGVRIREKK